MKITFGQLITLIVILVIIAVSAFIGVAKLKKSDSDRPRQAVFLDNGQVYFGYVDNESKEVVTLRDIYYLQINQSLQEGSPSPSPNPNLSLVKLGNELHGPVDEMRIFREHILFIEDMKSDSQVNRAIADFIKNGSPTPRPQ